MRRSPRCSDPQVTQAAQAPPVLATIHCRVLQLDPSQPGARLLPKSPLGKAMGYALAEREAASRYLGGWPFDPPVSEIQLKVHWLPRYRLEQCVDLLPPNQFSPLGKPPRRLHLGRPSSHQLIKEIDLDTLLPPNWKPLTP